MSKWKIGSSKGGNNVAPGNYTNAVFKGLEKFITKDSKELFRWKFEIDSVQVNAISGCENPTTKNALGKYLCALSGQKIVEGIEIEDPENFVDRRYFIIVESKDNGSVVTAFSPIQ